jgi:type II secretory pathway component PulK
MNKSTRSHVNKGPGASRQGVGRARRERGISLAIVVWFLAGMSLLVSGLVYQARVDTRLAQVHVARAEAAAAGDGAINLFLAGYLAPSARDSEGGALLLGEYPVGEHRVRVEMVAAAGLIDIRTAPAGILAALFTAAAGVSPGDAQAMADNVVKLRPSSFRLGLRRDDEPQREPPISAVEDLVRVEGVGRTVFDAVRDLVTVGGGGRGGVDWNAAPPEVLAVLASAYPKRAAGFEKRAADEADNNQRSRKPVSQGVFRIDAFTHYGDRTWLRRRWVSLGGGSGGLPWRFTRTEAVRVVDNR